MLVSSANLLPVSPLGIREEVLEAEENKQLFLLVKRNPFS
jgi:hypothetical protein